MLGYVRQLVLEYLLQSIFILSKTDTSNCYLLTCWLIRMMAISLRFVYSINVSSIVLKGVSIKGKYEVKAYNIIYLLASTTKKFLFCCWFTLPMPASKRPVTESYKVYEFVYFFLSNILYIQYLVTNNCNKVTVFLKCCSSSRHYE